MFEYVRPQTIYPAIAVLPWAFYSILLCGISFLVEGGVFRSVTFADGALAGFSVIVLASSAVAVYPSESLDQLSVYFSWVLIYWLITNVVNTRERFVVFMAAYFIYCLKMSQHGARSWAEAGFMFRTWGTTCAPGWFNNSGECGIQMVIYFSLSLFFVLALRAYWGRIKSAFFWFMPLSAAVTIMGSSSRGGLLGLAAVGMWLLARTRQRVKAFIFIGVACTAMWFVLPAEFKQRFSDAGEDKSSVLRLQYWKDGVVIAREHPLLGIGYNNWLKFYRARYNAEGQLVHNIFIQAGAELGYTGLAAFLVLIGANFAMNRRTRRLAKQLGDDRMLYNMALGLDGALVGFLVSGFFVTVLYYPFFWINYAMSAALYNVAIVDGRKAEAALAASRWAAAPAGAPAAAGANGRPGGQAEPAGPVGPPSNGGRPALAWPRGGPLLSPDPLPPAT
jgi:O-antigen ligase